MSFEMKLKPGERVTYMMWLHKPYYSAAHKAADRGRAIVAAVNQVASSGNFGGKCLQESPFRNFWRPACCWQRWPAAGAFCCCQLPVPVPGGRAVSVSARERPPRPSAAHRQRAKAGQSPADRPKMATGCHGARATVPGHPAPLDELDPVSTRLFC